MLGYIHKIDLISLATPCFNKHPSLSHCVSRLLVLIHDRLKLHKTIENCLSWDIILHILNYFMYVLYGCKSQATRYLLITQSLPWYDTNLSYILLITQRRSLSQLYLLSCVQTASIKHKKMQSSPPKKLNFAQFSPQCQPAWFQTSKSKLSSLIYSQI